jgi:cytochrome P450
MKTESSRTAPRVRGVPLFGLLFEVWRDPIAMMMRAWREHGDVVACSMGPYEYLFVNDPEAVQHVLVHNAKGYVKSPNYRGIKLVVGEGLLTSEGEHWRRQRKLTQPAFHRDRLAGFGKTMVDDTMHTVDRWSKRVGQTIDVHDEMMRLTFRIVGHTLFSVNLDDDADRIGVAVTEAIHHANDYVASPVRVPSWVPTPANARFKRALAVMDDVVQRIIEEHRRGEPKDDVLSMLMAARDEETKDAMSDRQLRDEILTIVLAGHETTANLLAWTLYLLSKHPDVERRVHREVTDVVGDRRATLADLSKLTFTTHVLEESMRLYPPAWSFERQATEDDVVAGYEVKAGTIVALSPYLLHRHPRHWDNPEGFDPERFSPERSAGRPRYAYLPFGAGPRTCIGNGFAMMEAQLLLATLVQKHRLVLVSGPPVELEPMVTLRPKGGIRMIIEERARAAKPVRQAENAPSLGG